MEFLFRVTVTRDSGMNKSRDAVMEELVNELPSSVQVDDTEFSMDWNEEPEPPKTKRRKR